MKETKSTNPELIQLVRFLKKKGNANEAKIWREVAKHLAKTATCIG
jgi:ribosomal protein L18E